MEEEPKYSIIVYDGAVRVYTADEKIDTSKLLLSTSDGYFDFYENFIEHSAFSILNTSIFTRKKNG